jgi:PD-(D/E)XK nuclease superfamily protein
MAEEKKYVIMDATLMSSLASCGRFFDIRYNHQLTSMRGKSNSLEVGALVHKILEVYYKHMINGFRRETAISQGLVAGQMYIDGCPYCADESVAEPQCRHEPGEYPGLQNTPEQSDGKDVGWRWALDTAQQYFDFYKNDAWIPLAAEEVRGDIVYEDDDIKVLWKAKFDLIIDTNQIGIISMDHKTMKQRRDKTSLSNQFMGQCFLMKARNIIVNKIGFQTSLKPQEKFVREVVNYSADRLDEWANELIPVYAYRYLQYTEMDYWPPNFTHCDSIYGSCMFKSVCEANRNMREDILRAEFKQVPRWDIANREDE